METLFLIESDSEEFRNFILKNAHTNTDNTRIVVKKNVADALKALQKTNGSIIMTGGSTRQEMQNIIFGK